MNELPLTATLRRTASPEEPWLGLEFYREEDRSLFFGREAETEELLRMLRREVLTILFGPAGTGKTSLLNAGLFPHLRQENCLPISVRLDYSPASAPPEQQIRGRILETLRECKIDEEPVCPQQVSDGEESLWEYLHGVDFWDKRNQPITPVLFFDQFEEVFTLGKGGEKTHEFLTQLANLVENYIPTPVRERLERSGNRLPYQLRQGYKVVLSIREDFVHRLDSLQKAMPSVMHNRYALAQMNGEQALDAVLNPGRGIVSEPVAQLIVRRAAAQADDTGNLKCDDVSPLKDLQVEPALLSVICREHNSRRLRDGNTQITAEQIESTQSDILNEFYERSFEGLPRGTRVFIEDRLLTASGFRNIAPLEDALLSGLNDDTVGALVDRRLIRIEHRLGRPHLELTHDLLTKVVQASRNTRKQEEARARMEQQRQQELQELRRARRRVLLVGAAAALLLIFSVFAIFSWRRAEQALHEARARELATFADNSLQDDPERSLALAIHAGRETLAGPRVVAEVEASLHQAILSSRVELTLPHKSKVLAVAFSSDGKQLATTTEDGGTTLWDAVTGKPLVPTADSWAALPGFSVDGKRLATDQREITTTEDGTAKLWDAVSGQELATLEGHQGAVYSAVFSPDGNFIATASEDRTARLWDARSGRALLAFTGHTAPVYDLAFSGDGRHLATASGDRTARIWDLTPSGRELLALNTRQWGTCSLAFSPDGKRLVTGSSNGTTKLWDASNGRELLAILSSEGVGVSSVAFSPDGKRFAAGSLDGSARLRDAASGRELVPALMAHPNSNVFWIGFSADGARIYTASSDGTVKCWDAATGRESGPAFTVGPAVSFVALSPDGKLFATTSQDGNARLWEATSGRRTKTIPGDGAISSSVAFSPDGKLLAYASGNGVRLWDLAAGSDLYRIGSQYNVSSIAFSPNRKRLATASMDRTTRVWDSETGRELFTLRGSEGFSTVAFSPDGRRLATSSLDGTVQMYALDIGDLLKLARKRLTRDLTEDECRKYFRSSTCPPLIDQK